MLDSFTNGSLQYEYTRLLGILLHASMSTLSLENTSTSSRGWLGTWALEALKQILDMLDKCSNGEFIERRIWLFHAAMWALGSMLNDKHRVTQVSGQLMLAFPGDQNDSMAGSVVSDACNLMPIGPAV